MTMATKTTTVLRVGLALSLLLGAGIQLSTQYYFALPVAVGASARAASGCDAAPPAPRRPRHRVVEGCFEAAGTLAEDAP
jgi:hypothetical protein